MEEQLRVRKKEILSSLRVPKGWVAIRQDLEAVEHKTKSGIFIPKSAAIDDADVRTRLKDDEVHDVDVLGKVKNHHCCIFQ